MVPNTYNYLPHKSVLNISLQVVELDLSTIVPSLSGPKRPHDRVAVSDMKVDFQACLSNPVCYFIGVFFCFVLESDNLIEPWNRTPF